MTKMFNNRKNEIDLARTHVTTASLHNNMPTLDGECEEKLT